MLCALAVAWAVVISLTGGFFVRVGPVRVSSRTPTHGLLIALVAGLAAAALSLRDWRRSLREDRTWFRLVRARAFESLRQRWRRLQHVGFASALAIVAGGLIVYQWAIARPLFVDEEMIALNLRDRSVAELMGPLWLGQSAPYGWLVVARASMLAFGTSERALRLVPALFGIATVGAAFWVGRRWMKPLGASILVLLCGIGQWLSFYSVVAKPYSADAFWALALPALGAWAIDADGDDRFTQTRRAAMWWTAAAVGQWLANGALLVTPACALVLLVFVWRRQGWRAARTFALFGLAWLAFLSLHYLVSIRHSVNSAYLQHYWSWTMAPATVGVGGKVAWLAAQLRPLAGNPGGATLWALFWLCAAGGFALTIRSPLSLLFATVPLSAFLLAAIRMVPLYERLSLWMVPAMYVGIALLADQVATIARDALVQRRWFRFAAAIVVTFIALALCADIFRRGRDDVLYGRPLDNNQQLDDRSGVRWLMGHARPGDAIMTTHLALPAVWWYAAMPIADRDPARRDGDETPVFEVEHRSEGPECERNQVHEALKGRTRALIYFGFRFGMPQEFDDLLLRSLADLGTVSAYSEFAQKGRAAVVDLHRTEVVAAKSGIPGRSCIAVKPARRW